MTIQEIKNLQVETAKTVDTLNVNYSHAAYVFNSELQRVRKRQRELNEMMNVALKEALSIRKDKRRSFDKPQTCDILGS